MIDKVTQVVTPGGRLTMAEADALIFAALGREAGTPADVARWTGLRYERVRDRLARLAAHHRIDVVERPGKSPVYFLLGAQTPV